ncbi:hypothetical protein CSKR_201837 [Clonorchis sinensis]|uniref:Uncharacterized protein n=1 Tax=Clonorchis sinensis TaxID=79923 RepID=A0A8T1MY52_CLOSI|nr:hypothetical protein CSKR_201837 [Clonorchis sinensis]
MTENTEAHPSALRIPFRMLEFVLQLLLWIQTYFLYPILSSTPKVLYSTTDPEHAQLTIPHIPTPQSP